MATVNFNLSSKVVKRTEKQEVLVRFFHGRYNRRAKTGLFGPGKYWDPQRQRFSIPKTRMMTVEKRLEIEELQRLNGELDEIADYILTCFLRDGSGRTSLSETWLEEIITTRCLEKADSAIVKEETEETIDAVSESEDQQEGFFQTFEYFVSTQKISLSRVRHYNVIIRSLKRFALFTQQEVSFNNLNGDLLRDYEQFLKNEYRLVKTDEDGNPYLDDPLYIAAYKAVPECRYPKPRGENTVIGMMSRIHTFLRWALKNDYLQRDPFDHYVVGTAIYGTPFYITKEERNKLYAAEFPDHPGLDVQRDIFVFQCFIGCRVGDFLKMTKSNIIDGAIEYVPRKTKEGRPYVVRVPLTKTPLEILARYPEVPGNRLLPFICEQDYNRDIKKMLRLAGIDRMVTILNTVTREEEKHPIWEVASSHMARRVLVGNLYKEVKDPNLIAKISGHVENSRAFSRYRQIDEEMAKETILKLE